MFKNILFTIVVILFEVNTYCQDMTTFNTFNTERDHITSTSMLVLGGWATGNILAGGIGMANTPNGSEAFHFHQMNLSWGVVNFGIALPAYLGARKKIRTKASFLDIPTTFETQRRTGAIYLINFGLDFAYIGSGLWLWENGRDNNTKRGETFRGFGTSVMMQGGFLLVYDLANYMIHGSHWKKNKAQLWQHLHFNGTSLEYKF